MRKKVLFIDRDGTIIREPVDYQVDSIEKLEFYPKSIQYLARIAAELDYQLVMVTNQDGLGTDSFPEADFWPAQNLMLNILKGEGIVFDDILIDRSFPQDNAPTRKPRTGLLQKYLDTTQYDMENSYVTGYRLTDMELARKLGCKAIFINAHEALGKEESNLSLEEIQQVVALSTPAWKDIFELLYQPQLRVTLNRNTNETRIALDLNLDGTGRGTIDTGIKFFDHMLDQLSRHGQVDLDLKVEGDLEVDEHHTIEDTGIALGEAFSRALGDKRGIERYGFYLPMDDSLAQVALDFGGRSFLVWEADFTREMIGKMPTEMFSHFFRSFAEGAKANVNIKAEGENEHHKIEAIFKAFAKAIKAAVKRDASKMILPTTKGLL